MRLEKCIQRGEIFFGMGECGLEVLAVEFPEGDERGGGQGPGRRRGLTVSSVAWISSMGTEMSWGGSRGRGGELPAVARIFRHCRADSRY